LVVVDIEDVVWFEVRDELVWAVTDTDRFALDLTLAALEARVPRGRFFRSHRGALVRLDRIRAIEPAGAGTYELLLDHPDGPRVPLARERARTLRELIPVAG
jgi:DNA-binding LytR/AlgR family response regulator